MVSAKPLLKFRDFSVRCDKSNPDVSFPTPWNWALAEGKKIAIITNNSYLRYQLMAVLADLVPPVSGEFLGPCVISWPVGGEGGLDSKLRVSHGFDFLFSIYGDCLSGSSVSKDEVWDLLQQINVYPDQIIKELTREQKDFFFLSISILFAFDLYLIPKTKYLMSKAAKPLRQLLLKQLEGKSLLAISSNSRFRREFCTDGMVLSPLGEILFAGNLEESIQWAEENLEAVDNSDVEDDQFALGLNLRNSDSDDDQNDDF